MSQQRNKSQRSREPIPPNQHPGQSAANYLKPVTNNRPRTDGWGKQQNRTTGAGEPIPPHQHPGQSVTDYLKDWNKQPTRTNWRGKQQTMNRWPEYYTPNPHGWNKLNGKPEPPEQGKQYHLINTPANL